MTSTAHDQTLARNREVELRAYDIADRLWQDCGGYEGASRVVAENSTPDSVLWPIVQHFLDVRENPPKAPTPSSEPERRTFQSTI